MKRRIDPADSTTSRFARWPASPPRVEIILPTGGKHQAAAKKRNWDKLLEEAFEEFPGKAKGKDNPYLTVKMRGDNGGLPGLTDAIAKNNPDISRETISDWVEKHGNPGGGKDKRMLTSEEVENIKNLIEKQGRLEFRILANDRDDEEAFAAVRAYFKTAKAKADLARLEIRAEPPPSPRNESGGLTFPVKLPDEPEHAYSWVELGKSELYSLGLNSAALKTNSQLNAVVENALKTGEAFTFGDGHNLFYVRKITDWTRRLIKDRELGKTFEYFVLVRDPLKGQEITGDYLVNASPSQNSKGDLTSRSASTPRAATSSTTSPPRTSRPATARRASIASSRSSSTARSPRLLG